MSQQLLSPFATGSLGVTVAYLHQMQQQLHPDEQHDGVFIVDSSANNMTFFNEDGDSGDIYDDKKAECDNSIKSFDDEDDTNTEFSFSDDDTCSDAVDLHCDAGDLDGTHTPLFFSLVQLSAKPSPGGMSRDDDGDDKDQEDDTLLLLDPRAPRDTALTEDVQ